MKRNRSNYKNKMSIVTINIPDQYLDALKVLEDLGYYPSRSEAVRVALTQFLNKENQMNESLSPDNFLAMKQSQMEGC